MGTRNDEVKDYDKCKYHGASCMLFMRSRLPLGVSKDNIILRCETCQRIINII